MQNAASARSLRMRARVLSVERLAGGDQEAPQGNLGFVLLKLGKLGDALAAFDKAIAEKSGADAYMGRAITRARMGDSAAASADSAEAHRLRADIDDTTAEIGLKFEESAAAHSPPANTAR